MFNVIQVIKDNYTYFCQNIFNISVIIIIMFMILYKNDYHVNKKILYWMFISMAVIICPFIAYFVYGNYVKQDEYYKAFYVIPIIIITAYAVVFVVSLAENNKNKICIIIASSIYILSLYNWSEGVKNFIPINNIYGVEDEIIDVCDFLKNNSIVQVVADGYFTNRAREYTLDVRFLSESTDLLQSRGYNTDKYNTNDEYIDRQNLIRGLSDSNSYVNVAERYGCNCIVIDKKNDDTTIMNNLGYKLVKENKRYRVYAANMYSITQYASESGMQSMIYTIEDRYGHLIIVDGGWDSDAQQLEEIIDRHDGHIEAWFITHPHQDHISAFNQIFGVEKRNYLIDEVYVSDFDYDKYKASAEEWDGFFAYNDFINITKSWNNIKMLHTGDRINVVGLDIQVLNSYSNKIEGTDAANDGSLMLKINGQSQSMLFCGDTGSKMSQKLIDLWGSNLKADYIQMGHHGNGGLSEELYKIVSPQVAFFDAPEWLMYPEEGAWYITPTNIKLMEKLGAQILWYNTSPNTIVMR